MKDPSEGTRRSNVRLVIVGFSGSDVDKERTSDATALGHVRSLQFRYAFDLAYAR